MGGRLLTRPSLAPRLFQQRGGPCLCVRLYYRISNYALSIEKGVSMKLFPACRKFGGICYNGSMDMGDMMTITEAAAQLKVARASVYEAIRNGHLRSETVLGRQVVSRQDVGAYLPRAYQGKRENRRPAGVRGPGGRPRKAGE